MTDTLRIISPHPSSTEALPAKDFPDLRLVSLKTTMHADMTDSARVRLQGYNYETKELSPRPSDVFTFHITSLFNEADRVPLLAQTMGQLIHCTGLMFHESELVKQIEATEQQGESTTELEQQLTDIRTQLGITE